MSTGMSRDHSHHMHHLHLRSGPPASTAADCWRLQTFDYSRVAGETPHATTFDLISPSPMQGGSAGTVIQPIYCPSSGRYGTSRSGPAAVQTSTLSGGTTTAVDYMCGSSTVTPVVMPRCGRPQCAAAAVAAAAAAASGAASTQMAYETPRFVQSADAYSTKSTTMTSSGSPTATPIRSAAESKVYFELHDAGQQQQRRPAVTFATNPI
jgi:hypothetical protein